MDAVMRTLEGPKFLRPREEKTKIPQNGDFLNSSS